MKYNRSKVPNNRYKVDNETVLVRQTNVKGAGLFRWKRRDRTADPGMLLWLGLKSSKIKYICNLRVKWGCMSVTSVRLSVCSVFCLSVFLSFCLSVFLSFCLSVFLSFCLSVFLSFYPFVFLYILMSDLQSICLTVCLFVYLSVCLFVCLSVFLFVCLSVCLSYLNLFCDREGFRQNFNEFVTISNS